MARVILWHKVKDFNAWKSKYDADVARRNAAGLKQVSLNRGKLDPNTLTIEWTTDDPSIIEKMVGDPELKKIMEDAGVTAMDYYVIP